MAKTPSSMLPLGTLAPEFSLMDAISGAAVHFSHKQCQTATVIFFICNHCPYVKHINHELVTLANDYHEKDVRFIGINANDIAHYPDDSPEHMRETALELHYPFPYLFDETQEVALAYQAKCTPDFFVFDKNHYLVYRGQFDDARLGNAIPVTGSSIRAALDCLIEGRLVNPLDQKPSLGCNIKWKPENAFCS